MRSSLASLTPLLVALFSLAAVAGCGGSASGVADRDAGPGPGDDSAVPSGDGGPVNPECPARSRVVEGSSCTVSSLVCTGSATVTDCQGNAESLACFCDGQSWTCEQGVPNDCELQTCPPPSAIFPGASCVPVAGPQATCPSSNVPFTGCGTQGPSGTTGTCACTTSGWSCEAAQLPCVVGPQCPSPYAISAYSACSATGITCSANPKNCEGQTYFDTYQCQASGGGDIVLGYWIPVATTACDISEDAGFAYPSYDASAGQLTDSNTDTN